MNRGGYAAAYLDLERAAVELVAIGDGELVDEIRSLMDEVWAHLNETARSVLASRPVNAR